jgi:hypothetical protein
MRDFFRSRGVHVPVASLGPALLAFAVQPAPPALVASVATGALAGAAASASGVSIAKGALAAMAWTKTKLIAAVAGGVILAAGGTTAVVINAKPSAKTLTLAPAAPTDWKAQFQRTYGLADGQVAKLVAPPFGPERAQYMRENRLSGEWPDQRLTFEWDGEPHWQSSSMGPTLETLMHLGVKLKRFQYDDPGGLLNTPMIGDWVFRKRSTPEERLAGVAEALSQHLNRTVRFEKRRMRGEVVVASGTYSYSPFVPPPGSGDTGATSAPGGAGVILATDVPAPDPAQGRTERGSLSQLFDKLEWAAGFAFEDKTESSGVDVAWQTHLRRPPDLDALLSSLRQQTGLTFQRQPREMDVWMIVGGDVADSSDRPWQSRFRQVYGLAPGQAVKLVGPPFIPERQAFWAEAQRQMTPQPPRPLAGQPDLSIGVEWQGDTPRWVYAGGNRTLWYGLQSAVGVNSWELDESIPRDLNMPGDWVTREGANVEEKLASLGPIVSTLLGRPVRFEKRTGPREAVVVRGTYAYSPLWTSGGEEMIEFFDATPPGHKTPPVVNTTPLSALWAALQYRLERRVFDETTSPSPAVRWRDYLYTADREALLRNLSKQTSLRFSREPRVMEYWTMVDEKR